MVRSEAIIIDWRYSAAGDESSERGPFSMIDVRLMKQRVGAHQDRSCRIPRFMMSHGDLSTLEHQIAELGFVPVLRGDDSIEVEVTKPNAKVGCAFLVAFGIIVSIITYLICR